MIRLISLLVALSFTASVHAFDDRALEDALQTLRQQVQFVDPAPNATLIRNGSTIFGAGLGALVTSSIILMIPPRTGLKTPFGMALVGFPLGLAGSGGVVALFGHVRQKFRPDPALKPGPAERYQTVEGLNEFMGLSQNEQLRVARSHPPLAEFLIRLSEAYAFVKTYQLE